jgi:histidinol-phosphate/aromatic aminotransferase/cobyric acid decarboxylase-like protein
MRVFRDVGVRVTVGTPDENDRVVKVLEAALADGVL